MMHCRTNKEGESGSSRSGAVSSNRAGFPSPKGHEHAPDKRPVMSEPLVVVGNGMAAARFCEELVERACGRYAIAVVGEEPRLAYNRVLLSSLLADEISAADVELKPARWWRDRGVTVLYGHPATGIDPAIRRVRLANGATIPYSKLVIATGSRPIRLIVPGMDLPGVKVFRDFGDVARSAARREGRARRGCRRWPAGTRSGPWSRQGGRRGHPRSSHGSPHGASARCALCADACARGRSAWGRGAARRGNHAGGWPPPSRGGAARQRTRASQPICWWWRSACGPTSTSRAPPASR